MLVCIAYRGFHRAARHEVRAAMGTHRAAFPEM